MQNRQQGFTLIELVVVIVILGILAATAIPKFIDLQSEANSAATKGVAGGISSAFATNYAAQAVNTAKGFPITGTVVVTAALGSVMVGGLPSGYSAPASVTCGTAGTGILMTITGGATATGQSATASATLICTG